MIAMLALAVAFLVLLLGFSTLIQTMYLESLRLRAREVPAQELFRETLEQAIGREGEAGALAFSIIKHTVLVLLGAVYYAIVEVGRGPLEALFEACLLAWLTMVLAAYLIPHWIYRRSACRWLVPLAPVARALAFAVSPLTGLMSFLQSISELSKNGTAEQDQATPQENIEALISAGAEEGLIEEEDRELIQSVVEFGDKTLYDVMTPRPAIVGITMDRSLEDLRQLVIHEQYSRIPVFEGSIDNILGFVHVRDLFELSDEERASRTIRDLLRDAPYYPEMKRVSDALRDMRESATHIAVVVDEYGHTAGLVTMEDLVEEIVGEIRDEHEPDSDILEESGGRYVVSGSFDLGRMYDLLHFRPEAEPESTTVAGLVTEWAGRVPHKGETVERDGLRIEVLAGNDLRVEQVRLTKPAESAGHAGK